MKIRTFVIKVNIHKPTTKIIQQIALYAMRYKISTDASMRSSTDGLDFVNGKFTILITENEN